MSPITAVQRKATLAVYVQGTPIGHIKSASWTGSFAQPYNEAKVVVTQLPSGFDNDQSLQIIAGNGINHVTRFQGICRSPVYNLDGTVTIQGVSQLARAYQYQNSEDPRTTGGLELFDLVGATSATDQQVVLAVLQRVGLTPTAGNIGGTGVVFGGGQYPTDPLVHPDAFLWVAADTPGKVFESMPGVGESALDYIAKWDKVSAIHPGPFQPGGASGSATFRGNSTGTPTGPVGFYRTFETLNGTIYRSLIGSRPRGTPTIATPFVEGVDIRVGEITRGYPVGNRFVAIGYDWGNVWGAEHFAMQSSNPYMPGTRAITCPPVSSPFMEKSYEVDFGVGVSMSCERVTYATEPDWNRIIVSGSISTGRDDYVSHGATILVEAPGGLPGYLGTGENVWVQSVRGSVSMQGFVQEFELLGGGVPDNYIPAVPQT